VVLGLNPVIELVKLPVPVPSMVLLSLVVGFSDVLQQTPRAVTAAPPSDVTLPPLEALVVVFEDTAVVLKSVRFKSGTVCECTAATSITIGPNVTIENGSTIVFKSRKIEVKAGVDIEPGAVVNMRQE